MGPESRWYHFGVIVGTVRCADMLTAERRSPTRANTQKEPWYSNEPGHLGDCTDVDLMCIAVWIRYGASAPVMRSQHMTLEVEDAGPSLGDDSGCLHQPRF